jgi:uncharacterized membrane protein
MEDILREFASHVALAAELITVLCVGVGSLLAVIRVVGALVARKGSDPQVRREIFVGYAGWIILALEFALGADIVRTAIAPTWDQIGQLAAIAAIRTALNFFLAKDIEERERRVA